MRSPKLDDKFCETCDHFSLFLEDGIDGFCNDQNNKPTDLYDSCHKWKHFSLPDWVYDSVNDLLAEQE